MYYFLALRSENLNTFTLAHLNSYHNESHVVVLVPRAVEEPEDQGHELLTGTHTDRLTGLLALSDTT